MGNVVFQLDLGNTLVDIISSDRHLFDWSDISSGHLAGCLTGHKYSVDNWLCGYCGCCGYCGYWILWILWILDIVDIAMFHSYLKTESVQVADNRHYDRVQQNIRVQLLLLWPGPGPGPAPLSYVRTQAGSSGWW